MTKKVFEFNQGTIMGRKTELELEVEANATTAFLSAGVKELMDGGVEPASLVSALAAALGVMMAAAPRHMAEALDKSVFAQVQQQRAETWAELDAAAVH
jgi:hypothetical protein